MENNDSGVEVMNKVPEMDDDEFKAFILANKDRIKELMILEEKELAHIVKKKAKKAKKKAKKKIENNKVKIEDAAKGVSTAMLDPAVQKHFVTMGIEMMMGIESFMKALPKNGFVKEAFDSVSEMKDSATRTYCEKNPNCQKKQKPTATKIELD